MSEESIITIIAVVVILVVVGIPLYVVRRRNRVQVEESEQEQPSVESTPGNVDDSLFSGSNAVVPNPVLPVKSVTRRRVKKTATVSQAAEKQTTSRSKPKSGIPNKSRKKTLNGADLDNITSVLSTDVALKHCLALGEKKVNATKKTTKLTKTDRKSVLKPKKSK